MNEHTNPIKQLGNTNCFFKGIENLRTTWPLLAVLRLQRGSIYPPTCFLLPPAVGVTEIVKNNRLVQGVAHTGARVICDGYLQLILFKHFQTMLIKILTFSKKTNIFYLCCGDGRKEILWQSREQKFFAWTCQTFTKTLDFCIMWVQVGLKYNTLKS